MTVIAIAGVDPQGMVHRSSRFAHTPVVRVDSTTAQLIGFLGDPLVQTRFGAHFLLVTGSPVHVIRPSAWLAPLVLLPFLCARGGADLQGLGLLDWWSWR